MSLCKLLTQRKAKVGCLNTASEESSVDIVTNNYIPDTSLPGKPRTHINRGSGSWDSESRTTRLSLCCAMTDSSHTPPHVHPHRYHQEQGNEARHQDEEDEDDETCVVIHTKDTESQTTNSNAGTPEKRKKSPEVAMVEMYENIIKNSARSRTKFGQSTRYQRGSSLASTPQVAGSPVKYADDSSDESPTLVSHASRRTLPQRLSADNLLASPSSSVRHSSPDSVRSAPDVVDHRSKDDHRHTSEQNEDELASMDSLARQSLLAAQVLHLIPADKARQRNFLQGRIAANSLLGPLELERVLPTREVTVFIGSWNMNGQTPPSELNDFMLPECLAHVPDVIAVGTQESHPDRFEWEVKIQETVGPSHVLFHSVALGTIHLAIFIRRDLLWFCSVAEESSLSVRPGTAFRTKGAVAVAFLLFGTSFLFITSHLTAHQDKIKERVHDVKRIVRSLDLPKTLPVRHRVNTKDVTQNFDCVFWFGDLNFRLSQPREDVMTWLDECKFSTAASPAGPLDLKTDQLTKLITEGTCLSSFEEGPITFPPTYKYDPGTQTFDTSTKQRTPAYTDRILFRGRGTQLNCLTYSSVMNITTSDHKPVWGVYRGGIRPGKDTIPLAAGLFNRDVYLEGIRRRVAEMNRRELGLSAVCSLQ